MAESTPVTEGDVHEPRFERVPRSDADRELLLRVRPPLWEHLLFAHELRRGKEELEPVWRDHELGYVRPHGSALSEDEAVTFMRTSVAQALALIPNVTRILDEKAVTRAFGPAGEPGDPDRITHLAKGLLETYRALLEWAATTRGALVPEEYRPVVERLAKLADQPLRDIRDWIDRTFAEIDAAPSWLREHPGEHRSIDLTLVVTADEELVSELSAALARLRQNDS